MLYVWTYVCLHASTYADTWTCYLLWCAFKQRYIQDVAFLSTMFMRFLDILLWPLQNILFKLQKVVLYLQKMFKFCDFRFCIKSHGWHHRFLMVARSRNFCDLSSLFDARRGAARFSSKMGIFVPVVKISQTRAKCSEEWFLMEKSFAENEKGWNFWKFWNSFDIQS